MSLGVAAAGEDDPSAGGTAESCSLRAATVDTVAARAKGMLCIIGFVTAKRGQLDPCANDRDPALPP